MCWMNMLTMLVLQRLLEKKLFVKSSKCDFQVSSVGFLGFIIELGHLNPDTDKIQTVLNWPVPTNRKQLQRLLVLLCVYMFIDVLLGTIAGL